MFGQLLKPCNSLSRHRSSEGTGRTKSMGLPLTDAEAQCLPKGENGTSHTRKKLRVLSLVAPGDETSLTADAKNNDRPDQATQAQLALSLATPGR